MNKTVAALALVLAAACSKSSGSAAGSAAAPAAPAAAPAFREAKDLLADDKVVAGYAVYQTEMAPHTKMALEVMSAAYAKAGSDPKKLEQVAKDDPRVAEYKKLNEAALAKAGITEYEMRTLSSSLGSYLADVYVGKEASDGGAQAKQADDSFATQYGAGALATVKKHLPELLAAQEAMMKAMMAK